MASIFKIVMLREGGESDTILISERDGGEAVKQALIGVIMEKAELRDGDMFTVTKLHG